MLLNRVCMCWVCVIAYQDVKVFDVSRGWRADQDSQVLIICATYWQCAFTNNILKPQLIFINSLFSNIVNVAVDMQHQLSVS